MLIVKDIQKWTRAEGDATGGNADIASAKAIKADIVEEYATYGIR